MATSYRPGNRSDTKAEPDREQALVLSADPNGNLLWERTFRTMGNDSGSKIIACTDGGSLLTGQTGLPGTQASKSDGWLVKLDCNGQIIWSRTYDLGAEDRGSAILQLTAESFILTAVSVSPAVVDSFSRALPAILS